MKREGVEEIKWGDVSLFYIHSSHLIQIVVTDQASASDLHEHPSGR